MLTTFPLSANISLNQQICRLSPGHVAPPGDLF